MHERTKQQRLILAVVTRQIDAAST